MKIKPKLNLIIDTFMFLLMMAIGGIGFLIKYILLPGSERWIRYEENVELIFWGMDRHQWGTVHLALGLVLLGLLLLHIIFHWKIIKIYFCLFITGKKARTLLLIVFVMASVVLLFFAFFVPYDVVPVGQGQGHHRMERAASEPSVKSIETKKPVSQPGKLNHEEQSHHHTGDIEINGRMTLNHVAKTYKVPVDSLKAALGIPMTVSGHEKLGQLRRRIHFHMSDIELYITKYHRQQE